jgi:pre-mRNA-splicing factor ATP-dependent RNA helicase DHX15/PRP43
MALGVQNLVNFDFMDPPAPETMMRALEELNYLAALDDEGALTDAGRLMAEFPVMPELAKVLIEAPKFGCGAEILTLAAMLSAQNCFLRPKESADQADRAKAQFAHQDGDHMTLIITYEAYEAENCNAEWCSHNFLNPRSLRSAKEIRQQLEDKMLRLGLDLQSGGVDRSDKVRQCLVAGYFMQVGFQERQGVYSTIRDSQTVLIHPSSVLKNKPEWLLYNELVITNKKYMRLVSPVEPKWLLTQAPHYFDFETLPDSMAKRQLQRVRKHKR